MIIVEENTIQNVAENIIVTEDLIPPPSHNYSRIQF